MQCRKTLIFVGILSLGAEKLAHETQMLLFHIQKGTLTSAFHKNIFNSLNKLK